MANHVAIPLEYLRTRNGWDKFMRCQDIPKGQLKSVTEFKYVIFVSHRWETPAHPDPTGNHLQLVRSFLANAIRQHKFDVWGHIGWGATLDATQTSGDGSESVWFAKGQAMSLRIEEGTEDQGIGIWYDYSCMPQKERTPAEADILKQRLHTMDDVILLGNGPRLSWPRTITLIIDQEDYGQRAWCMAEAMIATNGYVARESDQGGHPTLNRVLAPVFPDLLKEAGIVDAVRQFHLQKKWKGTGIEILDHGKQAGSAGWLHKGDSDEYMKLSKAINAPPMDVKRLADHILSSLRVTNSGDKDVVAAIMAKYLAAGLNQPATFTVAYAK
eukprot:GDKI01049714.1.p1 GENE.GDKI01049714.1~~GDKI01049714.1.p1  ORF type:complete len:328 (+),score=95.18 GDKI01049714.1:123-1106(+)